MTNNFSEADMQMGIIISMFIGLLIYLMATPIVNINHIANENKKVTYNDPSIDMNNMASYIQKKSLYNFYENIYPRNKSEGNPGYMEIQAPGIWNNDNYHKIGLICDTTPKCIAYDTLGNLYSDTGPLTNWKDIPKLNTSNLYGTYVSSTYNVPQQ